MHIIDLFVLTHHVKLSNVNNVKVVLIIWGKVVNSLEIIGRAYLRLLSNIEIVDIVSNLLI